MKKIGLIFFVFLYFNAKAQFLNGLGFNFNAGSENRLNTSLCFEKRLSGDIFIRTNLGYGNLMAYNVYDNTGRLFIMRRDLEPANNTAHLNLIYRGFKFTSQESSLIAPEFKVGIIYMLNKFRKKNRLLSGLYLGYQMCFTKITQPYVNYYQNDSLNQRETIKGTNRYYSWSPINLLAGYKHVIGKRISLDIGLEQTLGVLFDHRFRRLSDYYKNPYSGLKVDLSAGVRYLF
jgi:hypothetical protein